MDYLTSVKEMGTNLVTALVGTVEELAASPRIQSLVREQFESNFFGPVNCIKAVLPTMRKRKCGHVIVLTGISQSRPDSLRILR